MRELMNYIVMTIIVAASTGGLMYGVCSSVADFDVVAAQQQFEATRPAVQAAVERWPQAGERTCTHSEGATATRNLNDPFAVYSLNSSNSAKPAQTHRTATTRKVGVKRVTVRTSDRSSHPGVWSARAGSHHGSSHPTNRMRSYYMSSIRGNTAPYFRKPIMPRGMSPYAKRYDRSRTINRNR